MGTNLMVKSISLGILVTKDDIGIKKATDIQFVVHGRKIMKKLTKEQKHALEICNTWLNLEKVIDDDIYFIAYCNLSGLSEELKALIRKCFNQFMEQYGEPWDDAGDPWYPIGSFHVGYEFENHVYITSYTGDASDYWNDEDDRYTICRPC